MLNLTQDAPTQAQIEAGVDGRSQRIADLLTVGADVLTAEEELRAQHLDSRVESILSEIYPRLIEMTAGRALLVTEYARDGQRLRAWNRSREPLCQALVGGAPYLVDRLVRRLKELGVEPVYALTERVSKETVGPDNTVTKIQVFEHLGFIRA
jgi:hypothetical protein